MTCILYRKGKGTTEHGIECESVTCEPGDVGGLLAAGWLSNPPGYEPPEPLEPVADVELLEEDQDDDLKAELTAQVDSLTEQVRILTELDDASKATIDELTAEVSRLNDALEFAAESEEALKGEITKLTTVDESSLNPVRVAAKEKGIEGWDTKRIATLQAALDALESEQED